MNGLCRFSDSLSKRNRNNFSGWCNMFYMLCWDVMIFIIDSDCVGSVVLISMNIDSSMIGRFIVV